MQEQSKPYAERDVARHRVSVEAQTWGNTPPYPTNTMYRASCTCGWRGVWHSYEENVVKRCPNV